MRSPKLAHYDVINVRVGSVCLASLLVEPDQTHFAERVRDFPDPRPGQGTTSVVDDGIRQKGFGDKYLVMSATVYNVACVVVSNIYNSC